MKQTQQTSISINPLYLTQSLCNFSFFGVRSIFVLYAIGQLSLDESQAIGLYATFMSLCYATALIGGTVADRLLGVKNTVVIGGFFSFSGMLCFALPSQSLCFFGLALMSLGSGFFKPNLSTAVGLFFSESKDPQKDKAYALFYMAMNVGSLLAPIASGFVSKTYGWNYGFLLVSATLLIATYVFHKKVNFLTHQSAIVLSKSQSCMLGLSLTFFVALFSLLFAYHQSFHGLMGIIAIGSFFYLGRILYQCNSVERIDVIYIIFFIFLFAFFCSLFEQAGSSLMLFFEQSVNRTIFDMNVPASVFLSLNPLFVIILSPIIIYLSKHYFEKTESINELLKVGTGFIFIGLSFLMLSFSTYQDVPLVSPWWIFSVSLLQTIGELLIVPVILSTVSKFAPLRFRSVMMSFWFMAIAYGHYFAGLIAKFSVGGSARNISTSFDRYSSFFLSLGLMALVVAFLLLLYLGVRRFRKA